MTMPEQNPENAFAMPLASSRKDNATRDETGRYLLQAIKNSTTRMDQIVQRRIGLDNKPPSNPK